MKTRLHMVLVLLAAAAAMLLSAGCNEPAPNGTDQQPAATADEAKITPIVVVAVELVKGPDAPTGPNAKNPGVVEFYKLTQMEDAGDADAALAAYWVFIKKNVNQPVAYYYAAALLLKKGDKDGATELIATADKQQPT
ncbi:MAG: hypothetical protein WC712_08110 [Candidatus Brocadiia bacterium]